jgi:hypothetical protein
MTTGWLSWRRATAPTVEEWHGTFGHHYYHVIPLPATLQRAKSNFLLKHPAPALTSFAAVVLRKPA